MVFNAAFAAPSYKNNLIAARRNRFFHSVLNQRLIHNRQHFFGVGFGGGQKARAHACYGEYNLADTRKWRGH